MKPKKINNNTLTANVINNPPTPIKNQLIQKRPKKPWLLISVYILVFVIGGVTAGMLLAHNHASYGDNNFNPHSNDSLWEEFYQKNEPHNDKVDLTSTQSFFQDLDPTHQINWQIYTIDDKNSISFVAVLNQIDKKLQDADIETVSLEAVKALPNGFFANVINNPAVDFTINNQQVTNSTFQLPAKYKGSTPYVLQVNTNDEASAFGIKNDNISFAINITITNLLVVDIKTITLGLNPNQYIYAKNEISSSATIAQITSYIEPAIKKAFVTQLGQILQITNIPDTDYVIAFKNNDTKQHNFNTDWVSVNFEIISQENNDNFTGELDSNISVKNQSLDLSKENDLKIKIENQYSPDKSTDPNHLSNLWLNITFDNKTDINNIDNNLTNAGVATANSKINAVIKPEVVSYLNDKYDTLGLTTDDIIITSNLSKKDNLFQNNGILGKQCKITISPKVPGYKIAGNLLINITVHGTNNNVSNENYNSPENFKLDGIHLPDKGDPNVLQDGDHYYDQPALLTSWISDENSLKSQLKKAYNVHEDSFNGQIDSQYQLETGAVKTNSYKISDIKNQQIKDFYDLIKQTKYIYLHINVTANTQSSQKERLLNKVELIFTNAIVNPSSPVILYSFDMINDDKGISITDDAVLLFPNFNFQISYQQEN